MIGRRTFLWYGSGMMAAAVSAAAQQKAILEKGQAVVCDSEAVKCPLGHDTCKSINAPLAVGNDSYQNPDVEQLPNFHMMRCEVCHILFTRE
jgi:hypothetical protein